ncbi:MAG TPA: hypothetical protein VMT51_06350 [Dongiaceae bacterium]|nr:hypothetical protein [Dongiaceae bacterium]
MAILTPILDLLAIVGGICGVCSLVYTRRQTAIMAQDIADRKERDQEDDGWAQRFENLQRKLLQINPNLQVQEPGFSNMTRIYSTMYGDPKLRVDIESFIVELNPSGTLFLPRKPQPYEFRSPRMRETIERAEAGMDRFIREHAYCKQLFGA